MIRYFIYFPCNDTFRMSQWLHAGSCTAGGVNQFEAHHAGCSSPPPASPTFPVVSSVCLAVALGEPAAALGVAPASTVGSSATSVRPATSSVASAPVVSGVCLAVACGERAAASGWHLRFVTLCDRGLFQLVHPSRSLLQLGSLDEAFQSSCQPLLVGCVKLGGVVCFQVLANLCQANALALLEIEHGVSEHGSHMRLWSGFHFHNDVSEIESPKY